MNKKPCLIFKILLVTEIILLLVPPVAPVLFLIILKLGAVYDAVMAVYEMLAPLILSFFTILLDFLSLLILIFLIKPIASKKFKVATISICSSLEIISIAARVKFFVLHFDYVRGYPDSKFMYLFLILMDGVRFISVLLAVGSQLICFRVLSQRQRNFSGPNAEQSI